MRVRKMKLFLCIMVYVLGLSACSNIEPSANKDSPKGTNTLPLVYEDIMYLSFEETLEHCTNIIVGEYLGKTDSSCGGNTFQVMKQVKGDANATQICVHDGAACVNVVNTDISYISDLQYTVGETYLLVLTRFVSVYQTHDEYLPMADIYIPLSNVADSKMYAQEALTEHASLIIEHSTDSEDIQSYITAYLSTSDSVPVEYYGRDYIHSTDIDDVIRESEYVMKVLIGQATLTDSGNATVIHCCTITRQYQGQIAADNVDIMFNKEDVVQGNEYIVAVNSTSIENFMHLSSKASIFSVSQESDVLELTAD